MKLIKLVDKAIYFVLSSNDVSWSTSNDYDLISKNKDLIFLSEAFGDGIFTMKRDSLKRIKMYEAT